MVNPSPLAIVTGAAGGIGRALAVELARRGYALLLVDIDAPGMEQTAQACGDLGVTVIEVMGDVSQPACWDEIDRAIDQSQGAALLVNAAGRLLVGHLTDCEADEVLRTIEVNLTGALLGCRTVARRLVRHDDAPLPTGVLNIASAFATLGPPRFAAYNASKAGVVALTETLRHELARDGHTATAVLPGVVKTEFFRSATFAGQEPGRVQALKKAVQDYVAQAELSPERVAAVALAAYSRRRARVTVGRTVRIYEWAWRLAPGLVRRLIGRRAAAELG